ncbi:MAG: hypothetical protein AB7M12_07620 [Hyphomonadaceae bacterium]
MKTALASALAALAFAGAAHAAAPEEDQGRTQRKLTSAETYVQALNLSAPITANYAFAGLLIVDAGFDVPDPKLRAIVVKMQPRMQDALRTTLADYAYSRLRPGGAPDADRIAAMLQQATDRTLGRTGARVVLANVMVQRGR